MADPFSIVVGTIGVIEVCVHLGKYLQDVKAGAEEIVEEVEALFHEVGALRSVNESIKTTFEAEITQPPDVTERDLKNVENLWRNTGSILKDCQSTLTKLHDLIVQVEGKDGPKLLAKLDGLRKHLRKRSKEEDFLQIRRKLSNYHSALQVVLTALNITYTRASQSTSDRSFAQLSEAMQKLGSDLQSQITLLQENMGTSAPRAVRRTLTSAEAVVPLASLNRHFNIPQAVSSIFTGRQTALADLKHSLLASVPSHQLQTQRRFVVYGLGGSGKTQFCCKFAQDNRQCFWGVFWIDASSHQRAKQEFSRIAQKGKVEPNERAAKSWLSSMESPWLLIIDNADDQQTPIENYFPEGERGCILVTTRNPALKVHGTHGSRYHLFKELGEGEANDLLLRAADEPRPWSVLSQQSATPITKALGFLSLALVHAGKAILNKLCTLQNYLNFYERNWNRIRKSRSRSSSQSDHDTYSIIYSSYEIMYHGLEERESQAANDALDLLKMFSFFHRENIRIDILRLAATNPRLEKREQARKSQEEKRDRRKPISMSWSQSMRSIGLGVYLFLMNLGSCPVLPKVLRDAEELELFDEFRLRDALKELHQMSLITYNDANDGYSMHPLIHTWVRERPEMSTAEQASWCHAAATTLAQAILLPPLGSTEADEDLRRDLLPHIDHVQRCQHALRERIQDNQLRRRRLWPPLQPQLDRLQALQLAKFSLVYAQCGLWNEAEKLQLKVSEFVSQMLGMEHPSTMDIMLALSGTYWQLGRGNEAADLQQRVLDACINFRGEDDLKTLKVMDTLGVSRWQQARFKEARFLHERAINGLTKLQGADHVDTLIATGNLGRIHAKNCAYEEAIKVLTRAVAGLRAKLGISHLDTLIALDNLAMSYLDRAMFQDWSSEDVDQAHRLMLEVVEQRKTKLGKEHPYTLWAVCNLARVKSAQGDHTEAVSLMRGGIVIAERNLGETHIGTLFGKLYLGNALVSANKLDEAEKTLVHVSEAYKMSSREHHPDRLIALSFLVRCYTLQDRAAEVANLRDQIVKGLDRLGGRGHPMEQQLLHPRTELGRNSAAARTAIFPHNADLTLRKQSAEKSIGVKYPEDIVIPSIASRRTF